MADRRQRPRTAVARLPPRVGAHDLPNLLPSARSVLLGLLLLLAGVGAYFGARESSMFALETIDVRVADPRVAREVRAALAAERDVSLLKLDLGEVKRRILAVPDVRDASLDRAFPHSLVVVVDSERPVAVLRRGAGAWLVSTRGRLLRPIPRGTSLRLPRIWAGRDATVTLGQTLSLDDGRRAASALTPLLGTALGARVLLVRAKGEELTLVLRSGVEVRLGDVGDLRLKLAIARRILALLGAGTGPGAYLDVSVPERPVAHTNPQAGG